VEDHWAGTDPDANGCQILLDGLSSEGTGFGNMLAVKWRNALRGVSSAVELLAAEWTSDGSGEDGKGMGGLISGKLDGLAAESEEEEFPLLSASGGDGFLLGRTARSFLLSAYFTSRGRSRPGNMAWCSPRIAAVASAVVENRIIPLPLHAPVCVSLKTTRDRMWPNWENKARISASVKSTRRLATYKLEDGVATVPRPVSCSAYFTDSRHPSTTRPFIAVRDCRAMSAVANWTNPMRRALGPLEWASWQLLTVPWTENIRCSWPTVVPGGKLAT
jgi:hypothetical protein